MEVETEKQVGTEEEQEETTTQVESPSSEAEAEEETEVSEKPEGEGEDKGKEEAPKLSEEAKQEIIKTEYAKWQSKTLQPITKERDTLRKQVSDLNAKLEDKNDNKELDLLLKADTSELGEDEAKKLDAVRRKYTAGLKEYRDNKVKVADTLKENEATAERLGGIQRHQMAVEKAYGLLMPQDKAFSKQLDAIAEELEQAESPEHMERLLKVIARERQGKAKPFTPDSGRNSGSGVDLSKLSGKELILRGLQKGGKK